MEIASVLRQLAERARTQPFNFDDHLWQNHQRRDFARWLDNRAAEFEHGTLIVPESMAIPERFTSPDVTDFSTDAREEKHGCKRGPIEYPLVAGFAVPQEVVAAGYEPPGVHLPESLASLQEDFDDMNATEVDDHLRDIRQGLATVLAELDQIGESTQALLSARLYWVEFTETADGTDFATELADAGTKVRHLQRILAAAEGRSTS